jgi:hypothetical protein
VQKEKRRRGAGASYVLQDGPKGTNSNARRQRPLDRLIPEFPRPAKGTTLILSVRQSVTPTALTASQAFAPAELRASSTLWATRLGEGVPT